MGQPQISGNEERLRALGFFSSLPPVETAPPPPPQTAPPLPPPNPFEDTPILAGRESLPLEEKARILTDEWMNQVTPEDLAKMPAAGIEKIGKLAGLGGAKKQDASANPVILAIVAALSSIGVKAPEMKVIEGDTVE